MRRPPPARCELDDIPDFDLDPVEAPPKPKPQGPQYAARFVESAQRRKEFLEEVRNQHNRRQIDKEVRGGERVLRFESESYRRVKQRERAGDAADDPAPDMLAFYTKMVRGENRVLGDAAPQPPPPVPPPKPPLPADKPAERRAQKRRVDIDAQYAETLAEKDKRAQAEAERLRALGASKVDAATVDAARERYLARKRAQAGVNKSD